MDTLIEEWIDTKFNLDVIKKQELILRNSIIEKFQSDKISGTETIKSGDWKITIGHVLRDSLDEDVLNTIFDSLSDKEKNCIKFKPGLVSKEMKKLDGEEKLYEAITTKPGQNTLKIVQK